MWKIMVVGCNFIVTKWLEALKTRQDVEFVTFVDVVKTRAEELAARYAPGAQVYDNMEEAFVQSDADLVIDATPPFVHHEVVTRALKSGKHIIGEKPMAEDLNEARDMVRCAGEAGIPYFVMQNRRYLKGIQTVRAELDKGYLGTPYLVCCDMFLGSHFRTPGSDKRDFRYIMEHPVLVDMLIHTFDEARYLLGDKKVVSAYCQELNPPNSWYDHAAIALCTFEFEDGSVLSLRGSWASRAENTTSHGAWRVYCTEGTACWDGDQKVTVSRAQPVPAGGYFEEEGVRETIALSYEGREEHFGCVDEMMDALNSGKTMMT